MAQRTFTLRRVRVIDVPASCAQGFKWKWISADGREASERAFELFYECLQDARSNGFEVDLRPPDSQLVKRA